MRLNFSAISIAIIRLYRLVLSPWIGGQCRFHPTCSQYGIDAFKMHGFWKGLYLTTTRICSCHPYSKRPWSDPVPSAFAWRRIIGYNHPTPPQPTDIRD